MSLADTRSAIESRFATQWAAGAYSATPAIYQNTDDNPGQGEDFVRVSILPQVGEPREIGRNSAAMRYEGRVQIDAIVSSGTGSNAAYAMIDTALAIYRGASFSSGSSGTIVCYGETVQSIGPTKAGYAVVGRVRFYRDVDY